jgi:hypothetical protein
MVKKAKYQDSNLYANIIITQKKNIPIQVPFPVLPLTSLEFLHNL